MAEFNIINIWRACHVGQLNKCLPTLRVNDVKAGKLRKRRKNHQINDLFRWYRVLVFFQNGALMLASKPVA